MSKVEVKIGVAGRHSQGISEGEGLSYKESVQWLADTFEISNKRATSLFRVMYEEATTSASGYVTVILNYRQLARYTAKRQVEGLNKYWRYPHVLSHEPVPEEDETSPIELRPNKRQVCK